MKVVYRDDNCILIKFDESQAELRKNGWLGDESEARIFNVRGAIDEPTREIRIFKTNGESYVLYEDSKDAMVRMKARKLISFANNN